MHCRINSKKAVHQSHGSKELNSLLLQVNQEKQQLLEEYQQAQFEHEKLFLLQQEEKQAHLTTKNALQALQERKIEDEYKIEQLNAELTSIRQKMHQIEETLNAVKSSYDEREQSFKTAQQHLAKKLKEASILSEKNEEQRNQITELQTALAESQVKIIAAQNTMELMQQHEKRHQEQIQDSLKAAEAQVSKWEGKYFQLQDKFQELEKQNRDLKILEEKQNQVQALLSSLGKVMGVSNTSTASPLAAPYSASSKQEHIDNKKPLGLALDIQEDLTEGAKDKHTLFEIPEPFVRYKQTLFD